MVLQERIQSLLDRGRDGINNVYNNAPMLRFINPNNRYNIVSTGENSDPSRTRTIDGHVVHVGETNDGVFSNLSAKPHVNSTVVTDVLPSYSEAAHDPSPPYWETSVMSEFDEIYIDGIPVGNVLNFLWSILVSVLFQFLGFVITYLLHTSHAAKNGSQVGLGITIINLAFVSLPIDIDKNLVDTTMGRIEPVDPTMIDATVDNPIMVGSVDEFHSSLSTHGEFQHQIKGTLKGIPFLSYFLFALGGLIIMKACWDFIKVKRLEYSIMFPSNNVASAASQVESGNDNHNHNDNTVGDDADVHSQGIEMTTNPTISENAFQRV